MNYRHAFHAGNVGDCVKHALLLALFDALARKAAPFLVLDTHAGLGRYDLSSNSAERTGEWRAGIGRLRAARPEPPALAPYLRAVTAPPSALAEGGRGEDVSITRATALPQPPPVNTGGGFYPGSPALIAARLRPGDRLVACELHPEDVAGLRALFAADKAVAVHHRDGYAAIRAFLPPPERRALVLIDPPFEDGADFDRIADGVAVARERFPPAVVAAWYPIKHRAPVRAFHDRLQASGQRDLLTAELFLREPTDSARLNGCGVLVASPPWRFEDEAASILDALLAALGDGGSGAGVRVTRLVDE